MILGWEWKVLLVYLRTLLLHTHPTPTTRRHTHRVGCNVRFAHSAGGSGVCGCVCVYPFFLLFAIVVWLVAVWITTTFCLEVFVLFVPHVLLPERV